MRNRIFYIWCLIVAVFIFLIIIVINYKLLSTIIEVPLYLIILLGIVLFLTIIFIKKYYENKINLMQNPQIEKTYKVIRNVGCLDYYKTNRESCFIIVVQKFVRLQGGEFKQVGNKIVLHAWFENQILIENKPIVGKLYIAQLKENFNTLGAIFLFPLKEKK